MDDILVYGNRAFELNEEMREAILATVSHYWECANDSMRWHSKFKNIIAFLEELNIYVVYDWPGHRGEWFFPTAYDVEMYDDYLFGMRED